jgi:hypothetical protein
MSSLQATTFETHVFLVAIFQLLILTIFIFMFTLNYFIMSNNHLTFLHTHGVPNSFPSCIIEVHLKISLLMNNYHMKHVLCTRLSLPHPSMLRLIHCICGQPLDAIRNHLLHCAHGGVWIAYDNDIWNVFTSIGKEQIHILCHPPFSLFVDGLTSCY